MFNDDALKCLACYGEISHALTLLKSYPAEQMETYEVSPLVNDPRNDSPVCIEPAIWQASEMLF
jgi:putative SOS response-associated peptidase YedK